MLLLPHLAKYSLQKLADRKRLQPVEMPCPRQIQKVTVLMWSKCEKVAWSYKKSCRNSNCCVVRKYKKFSSNGPGDNTVL